MIRKIRGYSLIIEIVLFPWINADESIKSFFFTILFINVFLDIVNINPRTVKFIKVDKLILILGLLFFINPLSYSNEFSVNDPIFRIFIFMIRYLCLDIKLLFENFTFFNLTVFISCLGALYGWELGLGNQWRLDFPYGDANYQSFIFGSYFFILLLIYPHVKLKRIKIFLIIVMISSILILIFGASRGSFFSILITLLYYLYSKLNFLKFSTIFLLLLIVSGSVVNLKTLDITIINRIFNPRVSDIGASNSRVNEVKNFLEISKESPVNLIFGNGLSSSAKLSYLQKMDINSRIHNTPFSIFFDAGLIGLIVFLFLITSIFKKNYRKDIFYLTLFTSLNSLTFFILTFYHFFIVLKIINHMSESNNFKKLI